MKISESNPAVSIALPVFNAEGTLAHALLSIAGQLFEAWELLLMDDGSTDRTLEVARQFRDPRIRIVADGVHRGLPAQLNRAVAMARGKYFARMDADDVAYPARLQKQFDFLESHPDVDLLGTLAAVFRNDGTLVGLRRFPTDHAEICAHSWSGIPMLHPTWMGRIEWFRRNPYRVDAGRMEDWELLFLTHAQSRFANLPEVLLGYREDSLSLKKLLLGRMNVCKLGARYGKEHNELGLFLKIITGQTARTLLDIVALSTGLGHRLLRHRALPATAAEAEEWKKVWSTITSYESREREAFSSEAR